MTPCRQPRAALTWHGPPPPPAALRGDVHKGYEGSSLRSGRRLGRVRCVRCSGGRDGRRRRVRRERERRPRLYWAVPGRAGAAPLTLLALPATGAAVGSGVRRRRHVVERQGLPLVRSGTAAAGADAGARGACHRRRDRERLRVCSRDHGRAVDRVARAGARARAAAHAPAAGLLLLRRRDRGRPPVLLRLRLQGGRGGRRRPGAGRRGHG